LGKAITGFSGSDTSGRLMGAGEFAGPVFVEAEGAGAGGRVKAEPAPPAEILDISEVIFVRPLKK
jgi:hypothetical protein